MEIIKALHEKVKDYIAAELEEKVSHQRRTHKDIKKIYNSVCKSVAAYLFIGEKPNIKRITDMAIRAYIEKVDVIEEAEDVE